MEWGSLGGASNSEAGDVDCGAGAVKQVEDVDSLGDKGSVNKDWGGGVVAVGSDGESGNGGVTGD